MCFAIQVVGHFIQRECQTFFKLLLGEVNR
jgi:hypothetical protein